MNDSYEVVTAALTAHAGGLGRLSDELRSATDQAGQGMTDAAYGKTCQPFATMLDALANAGHQTLQAAVESLEAEASNVRKAANAYTRQEAGTAATFRGKLQ